MRLDCQTPDFATVRIPSLLHDFRKDLKKFKKIKKLLDELLTIVLSYTLHYCGDVGLFVLPK